MPDVYRDENASRKARKEGALIALAGQAEVADVVAAFGFPQSSVYRWKAKLKAGARRGRKCAAPTPDTQAEPHRPLTRKDADDLTVSAYIVEIDAANDGAYGYPRMRVALRDYGIYAGRDRVARLMRALDINGAVNQKRVTTLIEYSPNLLERRFQVDELNRVWLTDITQIRTVDGWLYIAVVIDLCSRCVVGWAMSERNDTDLALCALRRAVRSRRPPPGLIFHSDRGAQFSSRAFRRALKRYRMRQSMSALGTCHDNAPMESFFSTMKREFFCSLVRKTGRKASKTSREIVRRRLAKHLHRYNVARIHSALGMSPAAFEALPRAARSAHSERAVAARRARHDARVRRFAMLRRMRPLSRARRAVARMVGRRYQPAPREACADNVMMN